MLVVALACVPALALLVAALLLGYRREETLVPVIRAVPPVAPPRVREEDRVRPAVDSSGAKIWIDEDEIVWHEIIAWPDSEGRRQPPTALGA